jgi:hypothetical protein
LFIQCTILDFKTHAWIFSGKPLAPDPLLCVKKYLSPSLSIRNCSATMYEKVGPSKEPAKRTKLGPILKLLQSWHFSGIPFISFE